MNWHICAIAHYLEQVRLGKIKRLIITVPPRSLKSIMCSVAFPAFVLGQDPTKRLIVVSYGADLAIKHGNDFRAVVNSVEYRAIFPGMRISAMKNTQTEVVTTQNGFRLANSVDGALTGRGGDIIITPSPRWRHFPKSRASTSGIGTSTRCCHGSMTNKTAPSCS
jgi:hypothetical protein